MDQDQAMDVEERPTREEILNLIKQRDQLDQQIQALGEILRANNIGMTEPLVDEEGFPRNDIDVYQVRHARHRIIILQNDYKDLMKRIETKMELFHAHMRNSSVEEFNLANADADQQGQNALIPIARVTEVFDKSPAQMAGLKAQDEIISFGSINSENFVSIMDIGKLVQRSEGQAVNIQIKRDGRPRLVALIPGPWEGRGLLGCHIIGIETSLDR